MRVSFGLNPLGVLARRASAARPGRPPLADAAAFAKEMSGGFARALRSGHRAASGTSGAQPMRRSSGLDARRRRGLSAAVRRRARVRGALARAVSVTLAAGPGHVDPDARQVPRHAAVVVARARGGWLARRRWTSRGNLLPDDGGARSPYEHPAAPPPAVSGAALGGASSICVLPFSSRRACRTPSRGAWRASAARSSGGGEPLAGGRSRRGCGLIVEHHDGGVRDERPGACFKGSEARAASPWR